MMPNLTKLIETQLTRPDRGNQRWFKKMLIFQILKSMLFPDNMQYTHVFDGITFSGVKFDFNLRGAKIILLKVNMV